MNHPSESGNQWDDDPWRNGPWIVTVKHVYEVQGCSSETARRAVRAHIHGRDELKHDESWPPVLEQKAVRSEVHPAFEDPFDVDTSIKQILGE